MKRIPRVLTRDEVQRVLALTSGEVGLLARLLYGTGMRHMEGLSLRVKDVDFDRHVIVVRDGKGGRDRVVMLPKALVQPLRDQLDKARALWTADRAAQRPGVYMAMALDAKYPRAGQSWAWHWVFPSPTLAHDPRSGIERRHYLSEQRLQRALKRAVAQAEIHKPMSVHTLRHWIHFCQSSDWYGESLQTSGSGSGMSIAAAMRRFAFAAILPAATGWQWIFVPRQIRIRSHGLLGNVTEQDLHLFCD